jgi:putative nucleotidyltransferase with HDIG domain
VQGYETGSILVTDDEAYIRDILCRMLMSAGYSCSACADGSEALNKLAGESYALLLLDLKMPGRSGEEVLLEAAARYPETAVIMVTAIADVKTVIRLMKFGAYDYLVKPVDLDMLLLSVNRALEKRRLRLENHDYQLRLEDKVREQTAKIRGNLCNSITSLAFALEAKDEYTSGHSQRVAEIAAAIGRELELPGEAVEQIKFAGLVHDIGKIGTKETVLNKNNKLTQEEYDHISAHTLVGERILRPLMEDDIIPLMVRHHHERFDGWGYPDRLKAEEIPLGARILAVADAYDAMTSDRSYRPGVGYEAALIELGVEAGAQFDPEVVKAFKRIKGIASLRLVGQMASARESR